MHEDEKILKLSKDKEKLRGNNKQIKKISSYAEKNHENHENKSINKAQQ